MTMGRHGNPAVERALKMALRGQPLAEAWEKNGKPGTWGNVQRRFKLAMVRPCGHQCRCRQVTMRKSGCFQFLSRLGGGRDEGVVSSPSRCQC